jgi:hypothetical protein
MAARYAEMEREHKRRKLMKKLKTWGIRAAIFIVLLVGGMIAYKAIGQNPAHHATPAATSTTSDAPK